METGSIDPALSDFLTDTDPIVADIFCNDLLMVSVFDNLWIVNKMF